MQFLDRVRDALHLRPSLATTSHGGDVDRSVLTATAALLVAAAYGDGEFDPAERRSVQKSLRSAFGISSDEARALLEAAEEVGLPGDALEATAAAVAENLDAPQRQQVLGLIWAVVYADLVVDDAEVELVARVTPSLGLSADESQEARAKAFQWFSTSRSGETGQR